MCDPMGRGLVRTAYSSINHNVLSGDPWEPPSRPARPGQPRWLMTDSKGLERQHSRAPRLIAVHGSHLAPKLRALYDLAQSDDARVAQRARAKHEAIGLAPEERELESHAAGPGRRCQPDVRLPAGHGADDVSVRAEELCGRVNRLRINPLAHKLTVEVLPDASRLWAARQSPTPELTQVLKADSTPHGKTNLSVREVDERQGLVGKSRGPPAP